MTFQSYARYYDIIYRDKPYRDEAVFVADRLAALGPHPPGTLMDLGCGSGAHAFHLVAGGWSVIGVDRSEFMLAQAERRFSHVHSESAMRFKSVVGDGRHVRLSARVDAAVSLFHVASYQTSDRDLQAFLATLYHHVRPGGAVIFDFWNADAVEAEPPRPRRKRIEIDGWVVDRSSVPSWNREDRCVEIRFSIDVQNTRTGDRDHVEETHVMRYFDVSEIISALRATGFGEISVHPWMTVSEPTSRDFSLYAAARRPVDHA
jgi:SAM-dependent methyltransferase